MTGFFSNFPIVKYNGIDTRNIILRAKFFRQVMNNLQAFYPYQVKEGQRADMIANDYYGNRELDWLVYFSIDLIDPYHQWPMTTDQFDAYMENKYGDLIASFSTVHHYEYNYEVEHNNTDQGGDINYAYMADYQMSPTTYSFLSNFDKGYWKAVSVYENEFRQNENNRQIRLIDSRLKDQVIIELSTILK